MRRLIDVICILLLLAFVAVPLSAQERSIKSHPGYIDLDDIRIPHDAEDVTEIDLGQGLLSLMNLFGGDEDDEEIDELTKLFSIKVKTFSLYEDGDIRRMRKTMEKKEKELGKKNWEMLVRTKNRDEISVISIKTEKRKTVGLFIMSLDVSGSVSFVNIVGGLNLATVAQLGVELSDSTLQVLEKSFNR